MKRLLAAAALLALFAGEASAQYGPGGPPPPGRDGYGPGPNHNAPPPGAWRHGQPYDWCRAKAERLHHFERTMRQDGRVTRGEMQIADSLRNDLQRSCGGGRWNPDRGWYYR